MRTPSYFIPALFLLCSRPFGGITQSYHALSGSPYAGVTYMYNNPASTVNQAFGWDFTVFALQSTLVNTAFVVNNKSSLNTAAPASLLTQGFQQRYFHNNIDVNLFNARFMVGKKSALALGLRLRTYNHASGLPFNYADSISTIKSFLHQNNTVNYFDGYIIHQAWAEFNVNYSRIIIQNQSSYLSGGITIAYMKGLSGAFADLSRINFQEKQKDGGYYYVLNQGAATVEYSANYQVADNTNGFQNVKEFIKNALASPGLDFGAEYLFKNNTETDNDAVDATNYSWKIGVSIMDIGRNRFNPINGSFFVNNPKPNITDSIFNSQVNGVRNIRGLKDTLSNIFTTDTNLVNRFNISLPTRMVISLDRNFGSNFYVNGELSLNFYSTHGETPLRTKEINLLTITPRWETAAWGIYFPVQYNTQRLVWVGAAIKLGPLLLGVHSLDFYKWFKPGPQNFNGGGYILLSIHPLGHKPKPERFPCPVV